MIEQNVWYEIDVLTLLFQKVVKILPFIFTDGCKTEGALIILTHLIVL
jgi:hypothetical protein